MSKRRIETTTKIYECDPMYDVHQYIDDLARRYGRDFDPNNFLIVDCPACGHATYYDEGATDSCKCCGFANLADYADDAYTIADFWGIDFSGYDDVEVFNL